MHRDRLSCIQDHAERVPGDLEASRCVQPPRPARHGDHSPLRLRQSRAFPTMQPVRATLEVDQRSLDDPRQRGLRNTPDRQAGRADAVECSQHGISRPVRFSRRRCSSRRASRRGSPRKRRCRTWQRKTAQNSGPSSDERDARGLSRSYQDAAVRGLRHSGCLTLD